MAKIIKFTDIPSHLDGLGLESNETRKRLVAYLEEKFPDGFLDKKKVEEKINFSDLGYKTDIHSSKHDALKERLLSLVS